MSGPGETQSRGVPFLERPVLYTMALTVWLFYTGRRRTIPFHWEQKEPIPVPMKTLYEGALTMQERIIQKEEAGQTVMKYLARLLPERPWGFFVRACARRISSSTEGRSKEGKRSPRGDSVKIWFSDETIEKFRGKKEEASKRDYPDFEAWVLYEDENIVILNKPAGLLSQGDTSGAPSLNEALLAARESGLGVKPPSVTGWTGIPAASSLQVRPCAGCRK